MIASLDAMGHTRGIDVDGAHSRWRSFPDRILVDYLSATEKGRGYPARCGALMYCV